VVFSVLYCAYCAMVIVLYLLYYGYCTVLIVLWLLYCAYCAMVIVLCLLCYGYCTVLIVLSLHTFLFHLGILTGFVLQCVEIQITLYNVMGPNLPMYFDRYFL